MKSKKQSALLKLQTNAANQDNSNSSPKELVEKEQIPNTPFWIIGNKEDGYYGIMGNYKIVDKQPSKAAVKRYIVNHHWELVLTMATIAFKQLQKEDDLKIKTQLSQLTKELSEKAVDTLEKMNSEVSKNITIPNNQTKEK